MLDAVPPKTKSFDFPADLVESQRAWDEAWRKLRSTYSSLPSETEHWPKDAAERVAAAQEEIRRLGEEMRLHPWWATVSTEDQAAARTAIKQM
jgi:hypothetical protein